MTLSTHLPECWGQYTWAGQCWGPAVAMVQANLCIHPPGHLLLWEEPGNSSLSSTCSFGRWILLLHSQKASCLQTGLCAKRKEGTSDLGTSLWEHTCSPAAGWWFLWLSRGFWHGSHPEGCVGFACYLVLLTPWANIFFLSIHYAYPNKQKKLDFYANSDNKLLPGNRETIALTFSNNLFVSKQVSLFLIHFLNSVHLGHASYISYNPCYFLLNFLHMLLISSKTGFNTLTRMLPVVNRVKHKPLRTIQETSLHPQDLACCFLGAMTEHSVIQRHF